MYQMRRREIFKYSGRARRKCLSRLSRRDTFLRSWCCCLPCMPDGLVFSNGSNFLYSLCARLLLIYSISKQPLFMPSLSCGGSLVASLCSMRFLSCWQILPSAIGYVLSVRGRHVQHSSQPAHVCTAVPGMCCGNLFPGRSLSMLLLFGRKDQLSEKISRLLQLWRRNVYQCNGSDSMCDLSSRILFK